LPEDAVLNITVASHASWPYEEDWKVWEYIKDSVGGTININAVPSTEFDTKFPLIMAAPDSLPDLIGFQGKPAGYTDFCEQGAFVPLDDNLEFLPDYTAFWDGLPEEDQWMRDTRKSVDGKIYYAPIYGMERSTNLRAWLYREDVFKKHSLKVPETIDELYDVSKQLKALYPDAYPLCMRSGMSNLNVIGSSWKPGFYYNVYYDFENEKWSYGATEDTMFEMIQFLSKMVSEGLIPADFCTINSSTWEELVSTDRGFIMPEYQVRIDFFNSIARKNNPEYTLAAMMPPKAENGLGVNMVNKYNFDPTGYSVCNTFDKERIANAFRYLNWFYSDEGAELISWGKEGETYKTVDGKRKYIVEGEGEGEGVQTLYGFKTIGTYLRVDPESVDEGISAEQAATTDFILEHTYPELNPTLYLELSAKESQEIADYNTSISTYVQENIQKFIIGQKPLSEWDNFRSELLNLPVEELLSIYEAAYQRVK
ncbi:MAG: extracellular solute-binding protein, partial [Oscillospiraceae bacterium]|nr:extracellular solute-binding protein [Oscillospiraceae bacterium]